MLVLRQIKMRKSGRPTCISFRIQLREHLRLERRKVSQSVVTGFLIDPLALARGLTSGFCLAAGIIGALLVGKWIAAEVLGGVFQMLIASWPR